MKLVEMKCKNCGAKLKVDSEKQNAHCEFCGVDFKIDDEVKHIKYDDMEQSGYEFEKGKIRAREEAKQERISEQNSLLQAQYREEQRKKNLKWWIIGWIFFFPIPLTILIWKSEWDKNKKIKVTVILWIVLLIIWALAPSDSTNTKKDNINKSQTEQTKTEIKVNEKFIEKYNAIGNSRIEIIASYDAQNRESGYYRTEFRLGAYDNNTCIHGTIDNVPVDLVNYGYNEKDKFRFYASIDNDEQMKVIFKDAASILDEKLANEEIDNAINEAIATKDKRLTFDGNIKNGYIIFMKNKWEIFIESNIDFAK